MNFLNDSSKNSIQTTSDNSFQIFLDLVRVLYSSESKNSPIEWKIILDDKIPEIILEKAEGEENA